MNKLVLKKQLLPLLRIDSTIYVFIILQWLHSLDQKLTFLRKYKPINFTLKIKQYLTKFTLDLLVCF